MRGRLIKRDRNGLRGNLVSSRNKPEKVVVRLCNWIGDVVMNLPALEALRGNLPDADITVICRESVADVIRFRPDLVDHIMTVDDKKGFGEMRRIGRLLRRQGFDLGLNFTNHFRGAFVLWAGRIKQRVGFARFATKPLLTQSIKRNDSGDQHEKHDYLELIETLEMEAKGNILPRLLVEETERAKVRKKYLPRLGGPLVVIHAGAAYGTAKRWLPERYSAVCLRQVKQHGAHIVLLGTAPENAPNALIEEALPEGSVTNLVGKTNLRTSIAMIACADAFLSGDSGLAHVAGALSIPRVTIFGPTNPRTTYPDGPNGEIVYEKAPCSPCFERDCPLDQHVCMETIETERVGQALNAALAIKTNAAVQVV